MSRSETVQNTPEYWHWEDAESTNGGLSPGFAWIVFPGCEVAVAIVSQDRELYKDDLYHWDVTDTDARGAAGSMDAARKEVEAFLGVGPLPTRPRAEPSAPACRL